jgi:hypothetical protein
MADLLYPASGAYAITPSDTSLLPTPVIGLWFGGNAAGNITVTMAGASNQGNGGQVELQNIQPGTYIPIRVLKVWATGTSSSPNIIGFTA